MQELQWSPLNLMTPTKGEKEEHGALSLFQANSSIQVEYLGVLGTVILF